MHDELAAEGLAVAVEILGVNELGQESGNSSICRGRDIPWLQEAAEFSVWGAWAVTYRDVVVVNAANEKVAAYNLTSQSLALPANYEELKALLRATASPAP
jgi:hypothetical protein